ncbi:helix-turn-helix domain-containing protein [Mycobacterium gallinarum]|nr:helix-turn-helix domain-containing protein [Mycobacterium gallinarum]
MSTPAVDNSPRSYRGCSTTVRRRGTIRTTPVADVVAIRRGRRMAGREVPSPTQFVNLEIEPDAHSGVACWSGGPTRWAQVTVACAYDQQYPQIREQMTAPVSKRAVVTIAAEMARFADRSTGRNCRPSVATLATRTGFSERTVQRARECLRLLGVATEVVRGRQRTYVERMASWRMGDRSRGWASVWALHDNQQVNRVIHKLTPHLERSPLRTAISPWKRLFTTHAGAGGARQGVATRRRSIDHQGQALARRWRAHPKAPPWSSQYSTASWAALLAAPARAGWTAEDLNGAVSDWLVGGHRIPDSPSRPIGLMGAILAAYTAHNELSVRPTVYVEAAAAAAATERAEQRRRSAEDHEAHARAREIGRQALHGPGRAEVADVLAAIRKRRGHR